MSDNKLFGVLVAIGIAATIGVMFLSFDVDRKVPTVQQAAQQLSQPEQVAIGEGEGEAVSQEDAGLTQ